MPISEYILLALLATGAISLPDGNPTIALGADAIAQPNGGVESEANFNTGIALIGQATSGSPGKQTGTGRKGRRKTTTRRNRRTNGNHPSTNKIRPLSKDKKG